MKTNNMILIPSLYFNHWAFIAAIITFGLAICLIIVLISLKNKDFKNKIWIRRFSWFLSIIQAIFFMIWLILGWR